MSATLARYGIALPKSRWGRTALGGGLVAGGLLSFLPLLGVWMLPLGLIVLSTDWPRIRQWRRTGEVRILRRWRKLPRVSRSDRGEVLAAR